MAVENVSLASPWEGVSVNQDGHQQENTNVRKYALGDGNLSLVVNTGQRNQAT